MSNNKFKVAVVGSTGIVGRTVLKVLEEKNFSNCEYTLFSSSKSAGSRLSFLGQNYIICELTETSFDYHFDFAIFCAGGDVSKKFAEKIRENVGIIANPNCSTIQAVVALKPLDLKYGIKRVVYSTYQAVSGAGRQGVLDLENGLKGEPTKKFPYPIVNNCLPHIDSFLDDGYTKEEYKLINETRKILNKPFLPVTATAVRVPVKNCHSECINVEFERDFDVFDVKQLLQNSPGVLVIDDPSKNYYPIASKADGTDDVLVGRIRRDFSVRFGLNLWVVSDNLRKGAASNAVQILECLISS